MKVGHVFETTDSDGASPQIVAEQYARGMLEEGNLEPGESRHVFVWDERNFKGLFLVTAEPKVERIL